MRLGGNWVVVLALGAIPALTGVRDTQWDQVDAAVKQGLPKSAIAALEPIIEGATKEKAYAEAIRAITLRIAMEGRIQGDKAEEKIVRLQTEIAARPAVMRPAMEAILAHWYWEYFQQNRWRLAQRTQVAAGSGPDLQTWDLAQVLAAINSHFTAALMDRKFLQSTPIGTYDALLVKGSTSDALRPTLFDFLAHEALSFYVAGEQGVAAAEDAFELVAEGPILAPVNEFLKWRPSTGDVDSPTLKAVRLYQDLLGFHAGDTDPAAFLEVDLERLIFGRNKAVGDDKDARCVAALQRFVDSCGEQPVASRALAEWAGILQRQGDLVEARRLARRGLDAFPNSLGAAQCFNIVEQIEAKSASISTERVWNEPWPSIRVTYRNVTKVFFRVVQADFDSQVVSGRDPWNPLDPDWRHRVVQSTPVLEWNADLPETSDYQERLEEVAIPKGLGPGYYFIIAGHEPTFADLSGPVSLAAIWVSDLAVVTRRRDTAGVLEGFVLRARGGEPVVGARVRSWTRGRNDRWSPGPNTQTDREGRFHFTDMERRQIVILAESGKQRLAAEGLWVERGTAESSGNRTIFFTDRSLYRPGQTIYYKGICVRFDQTRNTYEVRVGDRLTVQFTDANGQEIARAAHQCTDYGSFEGAFTAPRGGLMGRMRLDTADGAVSVAVEEYKRPKFQVELTAPKVAAKLGASALVPGRVTAYSGTAIGAAMVKWRVVRQVRYPIWCWWSGRGPGRESQAIAHGTTVTEPDGSFAIAFTAKPNGGIPEKDEPVFEYRVHADVTDATGETRSNERVVRAGYTALQAALTCEDWQERDRPVTLAIRTTSLDGEPQAAHGTVKIHALKPPGRVVRAPLDPVHSGRWGKRIGDAEPLSDPAAPNTWPLAAVVASRSFDADAKGRAEIAVDLQAGIYRAMLETSDRFGKPVQAQEQIVVVDPKARRFPIQIANHFSAPAWTAQPGAKWSGLWGTGYDTGRAFVEIEHRGKSLHGYWTPTGLTQAHLDQTVSEKLRGGFTVRTTYVRENRVYVDERIVDVPWSNKDLTITWEHFRSRLDPGKRETWTAVITGPEATRASAELVAGLYDASLDAFAPHDWPHGFGVFRRETRSVHTTFANGMSGFANLFGGWSTAYRSGDLRYRSFPREIGYGSLGYVGSRYVVQGGQLHARGGTRDVVRVTGKAKAVDVKSSDVTHVTQDKEILSLPVESVSEAMALNGGLGLPPSLQEEPALDLGQVEARKNFAETAFFFPRLLATADGVVKIEFTVPEALTTWKFLGFAHDRQLRSAFLTSQAITAKDLMVEANPPRFVREGDEIEFPVKISNRTAGRRTGRVRLGFAAARTQEAMDEALGNTTVERSFEVPGGESRTYAWRVRVPDGCDFLTYKTVGVARDTAAAAALSDGEEGYLPVLSRRILVTESLPLPVRGKQTKTFELTKLLESSKSKTLQHQALTVQMVSQPAWYAVMALPYLMEFPHECSEQTFNRFYANQLARHIADSDPKVRRVFDQWRGTPALDSPLEKNQDLKSVMLEATPWLRQAHTESQARRNVSLLFDANRLEEECRNTQRKLAEMQSADGTWPWFPGGPSNQYITLYIVTGFGRLRHLGVKSDIAVAVRALEALDAWLEMRYREILRLGHQDRNHLDPTVALYLYGRSFFLKDRPVAEVHREALDYWQAQARTYWLASGNRQSQAHIALGLQRFGDEATPRAIVKSLAEYAVHDAELGMFWRDTESSWWWYRAPIETQAMMIEVFSEVGHDSAAVEDCKVWLLKQKQTQDWKTTKATADAIYALLLRGAAMLTRDALVEVSLGGERIAPENVEAGTGFYEQRFGRREITPQMGRVTVRKLDDGVSWGSLHWQYLEDMAKVTPHTGTPLRLTKTLFVRDTTKKGQVLRPVTGALAVGDELVVRIELRTDRDMEYVHLEDQRGSGTEPVNVLSRYKYQDGLAYYESTRDTASHFFIDYLRKGVYVFEYSTRIQLRGAYQTGIAAIQCMYAPEFNSHSGSQVLEVR